MRPFEQATALLTAGTALIALLVHANSVEIQCPQGVVLLFGLSLFIALGFYCSAASVLRRRLIQPRFGTSI